MQDGLMADVMRLFIVFQYLSLALPPKTNSCLLAKVIYGDGTFFRHSADATSLPYKS